MRTVRPRLELGMELAPDEPGMIGQLDHFDQALIGRLAAQTEAMLREDVTIRVVDLPPVPVAFADVRRAVRLRRAGSRAKPGWIGPQAHGAAHVLYPALRGQQGDDRRGT